MSSLEHSLSDTISSSAFTSTYFKGTLQFPQYSKGDCCTFYVSSCVFLKKILCLLVVR